MKKYFKNKMVIFVLFLIVLNITFFVIGYVNYLYPKLGNFTIENVVETEKFLTLNVTPSNNATKYEVLIKKNNKVIYEKVEDTNQIVLDNLEADHNDELEIKVVAFNKNNEEKESNNSYNYVYDDPSFEKGQSHLVTNNSDLILKINGYKANEVYKVKIYYEKKLLYETNEVNNEVVVPYDKIKDYSGCLKAILYNANDRKLSTFNFYLNTPIVGKIKIISPPETFNTRWNDVTVNYEGGTNANHFYLNLYKDDELLSREEVFPVDNKFTIQANKFMENTNYKVILEAVYEDYIEIAEQASFNLNVSKKETTKPVYVSHNPTFIKASTPIELATLTEDATIYYTTDGTIPTINSNVYSEPIIINNNTLIKTFAVSNNRFDSAINTYDFQIMDKTPVIYLSPSNQYDNYGAKDSGYTTEKQMMNRLADVIEVKLKEAGFIVYRNNPAGDINAWNSFSNSVRADFHFAIHSNGSASHSARGIEIHVDDETSPSLSIATNIYNNLWQIYDGNTNPLYNRQIKYARGSLGEVNDNYVNNGALIEVAFHDNYDDAVWIVQNLEEIGQNIASSIISYYN